MYTYPLDYETYNTEEIVKIIEFLTYIEELDIKKAVVEDVKKRYNEYRNLINSKMEEKRIDREFLKLSGISIYEKLKKIGL